MWREDQDLTSPTSPQNGINKSYITPEGDLSPASPTGAYKDREVTVTEHILGGFRKTAKSNSPYTSFTDIEATTTNYGNNVIEIDVNRLTNDINSGKLTDVEILTPDQVQKAIKADTTSGDYWKNLASKWAARDSEFLVKGVIPKEYITIKGGTN